MAEEHKGGKSGKHSEGKHPEPHDTKQEKEDVQWPGKHSSPRTRGHKRMHPNDRKGKRKHKNW